MDKPELDAASLDALPRWPSMLYVSDYAALRSQARLALSQAARISTLEAELAEEVELRDLLASICKRTALALKGPEPELQSHSWADLPAYAVLQVEVEARLIADLNRVLAHANALRDALTEMAEQPCRQSRLHEPRPCARGLDCLPCTAMKMLRKHATPAQSLAAHDAEVLERAAKACDAKRIKLSEWTGDGWDRGYTSAVKACADAIRALAAQAATHSVHDGTSEVTK